MLMQLFCLLVFITAVSAAGPPYTVRAWRAEDGLPSNHITALAQTPDGILWIGTDRGLARFDGIRLSVVAEDSMRGAIWGLLADGQGRLWVSTRDYGVFWYVDGRFEKQVAGIRVPEGMKCMVLGKDGAVYTAGSGKFMKFVDGRTETDFLPMASDFSQLACTRDGTVYASRPKSLWTRRKGQWEEFQGFASDGKSRGGPIMINRTGALWLGSSMIYRLGETGSESFGFRGTNAGYATALAEQPDGTVWAAGSGGGLWRKEDDEFVAVPLIENRPAPEIRRLFVDREGILWVATAQDGLLSIARRRVEICLVEQAGGSRNVSCILELGPDDYLVGTQNHGTFRWRNGKAELFTDDAEFRLYRTIYAAVKTGSGSLWLGSVAGLHEFQDSRRIPHPELLKMVGRGNAARALCEDPFGNLWVGCADGWVSRLTGGKRTLMIRTNQVNAIAASRDGTVWVATNGRGVQRIAPGGEWLPERNEGLRSLKATSLYVDFRDRVWVGTRDGGIGLWNPETGSFDSLGKDQGLPDDLILQIIDDGAGWLWLGTSRGIAGVRMEEIAEVLAGRRPKVHPILLGRDDGFFTEECTRMVPIRTRDGRLCFGTAQGFVLFDPAIETATRPPPQALLEEASIDGAVHSVRQKAASVELPAGTARFELRFTGSDLHYATKTLFRYRMSGLDEAWTECQGSRLATFTHLKPGNYHLEVQARDAAGDWISEPAVLKVIQKARFTETRWFAALVIGVLILAIASVIWAIERRRSNRRIEALKLERAVTDERSRIAGDLHDGLGSEIVHTAMLANHLLRPGHPGNSEAAASEPKIGRPDADLLISRIHSLMLDLDVTLWATDPRHDNLQSFCKYLRDFASEYFQPGRVECVFQGAEEMTPIPLSPESRHQLFMATKEAFSNILKHSEATQVTLTLDFTDGLLTIEIRDNGHGFEIQQMASSRRHGLSGMRERLSKIGGRLGVESSSSGTVVTITLHLKSAAG